MVAEDPRSAEILKPILRGRDIKRYYAQWAELWLILAKYGSHKYLETRYPAIFRRLSSYKEKLQNRGQCRYGGKGDKGQHHWLELDNNPPDDYLAEFMRDKIVWTDISTSPNFALMPRGFYLNNTAYMLTSADKSILGVLNSKLVRYYFPIIATGLGEKGSRYIKQFVERIPIPKMTHEKQRHFTFLVDQILVAKDANPKADIRFLESQIDQLFYRSYQLTTEEIKIIEND